MIRSASVLGAVLALALASPPAWAGTPSANQTTRHSAAAGQIGSVEVAAPVRVASDGSSPAAPGVATGASRAPGERRTERRPGLAATTGGGPQTAGDSTGVAQAGSQSVDAPVRVLSDGDGETSAAATTGGGQTAAGSEGAAQIGSTGASAPVRVLSDGDDAGVDAGGGAQSAEDSTGVGQLGSQTLDAPVRVASDDGGGSSSAGPAQGGQTAAGSEGAMQVGSAGAEVPVSVLSDDEDPSDTTGGDDGAAVVDEVLDSGMGVLDRLLDRGVREAAAASGSTTGGTVIAPVADGVVRLLEAGAAAIRDEVSDAAGSPTSGGDAGTPAGDLAESPDAGETGDAVLDGGGDGGGTLPSVGAVVPAALIDVAGTLPLTGLPAWLLLVAGAWLLSAGLALLFLLSLFKASGRGMGAPEVRHIPSRRFVR